MDPTRLLSRILRGASLGKIRASSSLRSEAGRDISSLGRAMNEFKSWQSYWVFQRIVKAKNRYFRDKDTEQFLKTVLSTSENRKLDLPKERYLWRAQLGHHWQPVHQDDEYVADIPAPFPPNRMKPLLHEADEGRVNPKGIPYLYLATTKETAMAEVRPWLGSKISVGQFKTEKDMVLINCSVNHNSPIFYLEEPDAEEKEQAVWADIDKAFSKPITLNDRIADYVPTHIIAEFLKNEGFDGIFYKSMLGEGNNVALFDIDTATLVNCNLFEVKSLSFDFQQAANPYFLRKKSSEMDNPT